MADLDSDDYYKVLGVSRSADEKIIKKAYRKLAIKHHPDKNEDNKETASENFKKINEAYSVLSNKKKRQHYDQFGKTAVNEQTDMSQEQAQEMFKDFFGGNDPFNMFFEMDSNGFPQSGFPQSGFHQSGFVQQGFSRPNPSNSFNSMFGGMPDIRINGMGPGVFVNSLPGQSMRGMNRRSNDVSIIHPGVNIMIKGLSNASHYNDKVGVIESYDSTKKRYVVSLQEGGVLSLKTSNIQQVLNFTLTGLTSVGMNGRKGKIVGYDEGTNRYKIVVDSNVMSVKPKNVIIENGACVRIVNIKSDLSLNGKRGKIQNYDEELNRYVVLISNRKRIRVRLINVLV